MNINQYLPKSREKYVEPKTGIHSAYGKKKKTEPFLQP